MITKNIRRALALILTAALMLCAFPAGAFAALMDNVQPYKVYTCLGDSIASGYESEENRDPVGFETVDFAYHSIVANAVSAEELHQLAYPGGNIKDIIYFLEPDMEWEENSVSLDKQTAEEKKAEIQSCIPESDLVTINVGTNDVIAAALENMSGAMRISESVKSSSNIIDEIRLVVSAVLALPAFFTGYYEAMKEFKELWNRACEDLFALNPDMTLVVVGLSNVLPSLCLKDGHHALLGTLTDIAVGAVNYFIQRKAAYSDNYLFANVVDTDVFETPAFCDPDFSDRVKRNAHPTKDGHRYIAEQIVKVLPEEFDVTDYDQKLGFCDYFENAVDHLIMYTVCSMVNFFN